MIKIKSVCLVLLFALSLAGLRTETVHADTAPYLKAVTYFSDAWPINFWSTESPYMEAELAQIKKDGFNCIILAVPWREFQPDLAQPTQYTDYAMDKLHRIMKSAEEKGLWVSLRLGYTWDYYDADRNVLSRYETLIYSDRTKEAWKNYAAKIYGEVSGYRNFHGGFLTWEDFWNYPDSSFQTTDKRTRQNRAKTSGYIDYLKENYDLTEISALYGERIHSYDSLYLPGRQQPAAKLFYKFYDEFLVQLLKDTQAVFPRISMEVRLDQELLVDEEGDSYYYSHERTYGCGSASYTAAMISVPMGQVNRDETVTAAASIGALDTVLTHARTFNGGKPLFMEQFLYTDNTREFGHNARVLPEQVPAYITGMAPVLKKHGMGYGIWVYRNYGNYQTYNPQFALGLQGWTPEGNVTVEERDQTPMAVIRGGSRLKQRLNGNMRGQRTDTAKMRFRAVVENPCNLDVYLGYQKMSVWLEGDQVYELAFEDVIASDISFQAGGTIWLDDIQVYDFMQEGRIYDRDGQPLDCLPAIRQLNKKL